LSAQVAGAGRSRVRPSPDVDDSLAQDAVRPGPAPPTPSTASSRPPRSSSGSLSSPRTSGSGRAGSSRRSG